MTTACVAADRKAGEARPSAVALGVSGSAVVATAFGMARYGYGLLLPDIQHNLALATGTVGLIGTAAYVAYLGANAIVSTLVDRLGMRATVVLGGVLAVAGTLVVAAAPSVLVLAAGVAIAGTSAGLVYPPFAEVVGGLPDDLRRRTLSVINCGTGWGVAVAAPIAIGAGQAWRIAYVGFAVCAAASTAYAARTLPARGQPRPAAAEQLTAPGSTTRPLVAASALVGLGSAAFWTYAVDRVQAAGLSPTAGRTMLGVAGITSVLAMGAADVVRRFGARRTFVATTVLEAAALVVIAAGPDVPAALLAGAAFGFSYNAIVAVTVLWGIELHPERPTAGVAAASGGNALGLLFGPVIGGFVADAAGLRVTVLAGAAVLLAATTLAPCLPPAGHSAQRSGR